MKRCQLNLSGLTDFQKELAQAFLMLDQNNSFVLTGGAALLSHGISSRPTQDLDFFTWKSAEVVEQGLENLISIAKANGWTYKKILDEPEFKRYQINSSEALLVDISRDSLLIFPATISELGQIVSPKELGARKLLALFDRAAARDFVDLKALLEIYEISELMDLAKIIDSGFSVDVFVYMLSQLEKYSDQDLAELGENPKNIRKFFDSIANKLIKI
jgi:predicted nucleotidyltransferase component of viral defense system